MGRIVSRIADYIRETDKVMFILCIFASAYGCLAVYSSTRYLNSIRPFLVQIIGVVIGVTAAIVISLIDFERLIKYWYLFIGIGVIPVILTFFIGWAPEGTDDKAWLDLGFTTFQPSELLKICFIITVFEVYDAVTASGRK